MYLVIAVLGEVFDDPLVELIDLELCVAIIFWEIVNKMSLYFLFSCFMDYVQQLYCMII